MNSQSQTRLNPTIVFLSDLAVLSMCILYPLIIFTLPVFVFATIFVSNRGWAVALQASPKSRRWERVLEATLYSSIAVLVLLPWSGAGEDFLIRIAAVIWLFRLCGGVVAGCLLAWFRLIFVAESRAQTAWPTLFSTAAVASMSYHYLRVFGHQAAGLESLLPAIVGYLSISSGACLWLGAMFAAED